MVRPDRKKTDTTAKYSGGTRTDCRKEYSLLKRMYHQMHSIKSGISEQGTAGTFILSILITDLPVGGESGKTSH